jgi:hypothetical protein
MKQPSISCEELVIGSIAKGVKDGPAGFSQR